MFSMNQRLVKGTDWKRKEASLGGDVDTGILLNFKVHALVTLLDLHENLFLLTKRDLKRIFSFPTKGKKHKQHSVSVLQRPLQRQHQEQKEGPPPAPSLGTSLSIKPPSRWAVVCEHLHFISIHFVHLLARWVRHYQKGLRELLKRFMFSIKVSIIVLITVNERHCVCIEFGVQEAKSYFHID